jgi:lysine/ornithine N-monooxygenase
MSRVNRFIYNSDFMTLARRGSTKLVATIPARELGASFFRTGTVEIPANIPSGSLLRMRAQYTGTNAANTIATSGSIQITENKGSGKTIVYDIGMEFTDTSLIIFYVIQGTGFQPSESSTLSTAQTITLYIDYLYQPNT